MPHCYLLIRSVVMVTAALAVALISSPIPAISSGQQGFPRVEVNQMPRLPSYYGGTAQAVTPEEARSRAGSLLVPGYLPDGFTLQKVKLLAGRDVYLRYARSPILSPQLTVSLVRHARPRVLAGTYNEIEVAGQPGLLIYGNFIKRGDDRPIEWDADHSTSVMFERDGWTVIVVGYEMGLGQRFWTDEKLMNVAESMVPY